MTQVKDDFAIGTDLNRAGGEPERRSADYVKALAGVIGVTASTLTATEIRMLQCVPIAEARAWLTAQL